MKLNELFEMTQRMGTHIPQNPILDTTHHSLGKQKYVGKMQHGYQVFTQSRGNVIFYIAKNGLVDVGYIQTIQQTIPKIGVVTEILYIHVYPQYQGTKLSLQMLLFLSAHLGLNVILGNQHYIPTEKGLIKYIFDRPFDASLVNIKTGDTVEGNMDNYYQYTSDTKPTEWQVMITGHKLTVEGADFGFAGPEHKDRHLWTYGEFFEDVED